MSSGDGLTRLARMTADQRRLLDRLLDGPSDAIARVTDRSRVRLSAAQRRIWFFERLRAGSPLYVISGAARLRGTLDLPVLRRCLDEVVRRHEALRTTFHGDAEPWARIGDPVGVPLDVVDLTDVPEPDRTAQVSDLLGRAARRPFDLSRDLLLRAILLRVAPDEYLCQFSMHHIAADGWSLGVLVREIGALYPAFAAGLPSPLPELAVQYPDFAAWQDDRSAEPAQAAAVRDVVSALAGAVPADLPTDRPRRGSESFGGGWVPVDLPAGVVAGIHRLAAEQRATPYMVLCAALAVVLSRFSGGQRDVVLGCAVAGRDRVELEPMIGFFVNTLALRLDLSGDPSFRAVVDRARTACLDGYAHQDVPFDRVVEQLHPERDPAARVPLVRHMLVLHTTARPELRLSGLDITVLPLQTGTAKFELQFELTPADDGTLTGWIEYATDLFDESTVQRVATAFRSLAAAIVDPDVPITELPLLSSDDRAAVLRWSGAGTGPAGGGCLHHLVEATADRVPDAPALVSRDTTLTYRDLESRANRIAHLLRAAGVGVEDVVGLCLPRSADAVVAMLGVLKAGGTYLPLDPSHPARRLAALAEDAGARVIITSARHDPDLGITTLDVDAGGPDHRPVVAVSPDNAAYVLHTSGSTGSPKGAVNQHAAVANRIRWMQDAYRLGPHEAVLHKTPLGFDVSGWEWLWPLAVGARVVVAEPDAHRDPARIAELITRYGVTTCHFVPSMLRAFLADPAAVECTSALRRIVCSGEELPPDLARRTLRLFPDTELHNLYGPTEAAIDVTAWPVPATEAPEHTARLPIGFPIAGARLYVVDEQFRPTPPGVPGELCIGGLPVCRGYLGRPALTAQRFVPDPFEHGQRLYRTGDRARWLADGAIDFLGRLDQQVKIRGQRVEPAEVAAAFIDHPAVEHAVVRPYRDADDVRLAAYVSLRSDDVTSLLTVAEQVQRWREVFDDTYGRPADREPDLAGWVDSYTGQPIPAPEMRAWLDETVDRVLALRPGRVLEIGCGIGLLAQRIVPHCTYYCGTEISGVAIAAIRAALGEDDAVDLLQLPADDFTPWAPGSFDTVVLNSVTQYLPDVDYLVDVLRGAMAVLRPGGHLFVGDVRSLPLLPALHCSILADRLSPGTPVATLRRRMSRQLAAEEELAVHPALFPAVAVDADVALLAKSSPHRNELTRFRYDAIITVGAPADHDLTGWLRWPSSAPAGGSYGLLDVPDARVAADLHALRLVEQGTDDPATVGELRGAARRLAEDTATEPATFPSRPVPHLGAAPGLLDVEFRADGHPLGHRVVPGPDGRAAGWAAYANDPRAAAGRRLVTAELRAHAQRTLPSHMVPSWIVVLPDWPVGANGKLDLAALPALDELRPSVDTGYVAPRTGTERAVAAVWQDVLGVDRIGVHDDFFALGGHSLLAVQLVSRLRTALGRELPLGQLLAAPTVAVVAAALDAAGPPPSKPVPIGRTERVRHRPSRSKESDRSVR
ncbi:MAG TPA: amino acid adenylation domain-containing protein [Pseudonocardiaceae bacterium]|nr:amino acid adenylation domain-containing protein [Pseudonocardiaceae bacterium]